MIIQDIWNQITGTLAADSTGSSYVTVSNSVHSILYCVEWDVKLYIHTYIHTLCGWNVAVDSTIIHIRSWFIIRHRSEYQANIRHNTALRLLHKEMGEANRHTIVQTRSMHCGTHHLLTSYRSGIVRARVLCQNAGPCQLFYDAFFDFTKTTS